MKLSKEIENNFIELLWKMPKHWFSDKVNGITTMQPLSIALKQTFEIKQGYVFGEDEKRDEKLLKLFSEEKKIYEESLKKVLKLPDNLQTRLRIY